MSTARANSAAKAALIDARAVCLELAFSHAKAIGAIGDLDAVLATAARLAGFVEGAAGQAPVRRRVADR